jgi:ribosomal protein L22
MTASENDPEEPERERSEAAGDADVAEATDAPKTEPAPKPKARRKSAKAVAADAEAGAVAEPAADDADADEKPKRARRTRSATGKAAVAKAGAGEASATSEDKPKRRTRKKAESAKRAAPAARKKRPAHDWGDNPPMVRAHAKYVRTSARKARLVCDHIRGKSVEEARAILAHASRDVARDWSKLLESAVANAEHNHELIGDELRIAAVKADEGPTLKRFRPRAMGRATKIRKRTSHLSITLTPKDGDR